jgi:tetratricopeptide (TPR) repeat protein
VSRRPRSRAAAVLLLLGAVAVLPRGTRDAAAVAPSDAPLIAQGDALCRAEAYRSAKEVLERALAEARATGNRGAESDALAGLARAADGVGDAATAGRRRAEALALARALGDRGREARTISDAGAAAWARAEYAAAERSLRRALAEQRALGDHRGEALTLVRLGRIPFKQGRYDEALALYASALALQERARDRSGVAATEIAIGLVHLDRRAFSPSMAAFRRALAAAEQGGDLEQRIFALDHIAIGWMFQDAPGEARAPLDEALRLARTAGSRPLEMKVRHLVANVDRQAGHLHAAMAAYEELAAYCESEGNLREAAWNRARLAKAEAALDRLEDAKQSYREAIAA